MTLFLTFPSVSCRGSTAGWSRAAMEERYDYHHLKGASNCIGATTFFLFLLLLRAASPTIERKILLFSFLLCRDTERPLGASPTPQKPRPPSYPCLAVPDVSRCSTYFFVTLQMGRKKQQIDDRLLKNLRRHHHHVPSHPYPTVQLRPLSCAHTHTRAHTERHPFTPVSASCSPH